MTRLQTLGERLDAPLLVTNLVNVEYLTGFKSSNAGLLVQPGGETQLFTDFRYIESARAIDGVELEMLDRSLVAALADRLSGRVQFEADVVSYADWQKLAASGAELVPVSGTVEELRAVKDEDEVTKLQRAARIADRALEALTAETWVGRTEKEVAWRLHELCHAHGADDLSFEPIVASGPRGALPHGRPTDAVIERGTLVTVDWGVKKDGYVSDCTRTFSTGSLPGRLREIYEIVLEAQKACVAGIKAGMTGVEADAISRDPIDAAGYGDHYGHGLGHGVGLEVHEAPRLAKSSTDTLVSGHCVTIEPGIYLPGEGGVRIEDDVVVTEDGLENLTGFAKELIVVR